MTYEQIVNAAKNRLRKTENNELDEDIRQYIDYVLADLRRIGVKERFLKEPSDPLIIEAILDYVKAFYAVDQNHDFWLKAYNDTVGKVKMDKDYFKEADEGADA